ncbi:MAG TPA: PAC2 family protein [Candidatus Acidoferrum sp.]|nr:PAC2 family protein [Candidatus Acidoferrum sp.]
MIEGFPSIGLTSAIAGTYIVRSLELTQIAAIDSTRFPSASIISSEKPGFPVRICASAERKIAVCLSEFTMPADLHVSLARAIISWSHEEKCSLVISPCGMPLTEQDNQKRQDSVICGVGSNEDTRLKLKSAGISLLESGVVPGITGALLNEGKLSNVNVACLLFELRPEIPDARAVVAIMEAITKLDPQLHLDLTPLYQDAEKIETQLKTMTQQTSELNTSLRPSPYA